MKHIKTFFQGIAMGIADLVPGVSGGTIALLLGIYDVLIKSITDIFSFLGTIFQGKFLWKKINFIFLIPLIIGIAIAILLGARGMDFLLIQYTAYTLSFFIGAIIASLQKLYVEQKEKNWLFFSIGIIVGILFLFINPANISDPSLLTIFLSGFIAIAAMILPGISGSFILLLIGMYQIIIGYLADPLNNISNLLIFAGGAIIGLGVMSAFIKKLLKPSYKNIIFTAGINFRRTSCSN